MQVINECLDDLEKLEGMIDVASEDELNQDDVVFALASIAQSKAIAGLALAIKESGKQDTRRLTTDEASASIQDGVFCPNHPDTELVIYCPVEGCDMIPVSHER